MVIYGVVLLFFVLGIVLRDRLSAPSSVILVLNKYIIWFALPALILSSIPNVQLQQVNIFPAVIAWILILLAFVVAWGIGRACGWGRDIIYAVALMMGLGNTAFLGVPLVRLLLGEEYLLGAIIYDQFGSSLLLFIVVPIVIAVLSKHGGGRLSVWGIVKKILGFPPFVSLLIALSLPSTASLGVLYTVFSVAAMTIAPAAMLLVGLQFYFRIDRDFYVPIAATLIFRYLIAPVFVFLIGNALVLSPQHVYPSVMQSAMPPMITTAILLTSEGVATRFVTSVLGIGTLVACVTLPILAFLLV